MWVLVSPNQHGQYYHRGQHACAHSRKVIGQTCWLAHCVWSLHALPMSAWAPSPCPKTCRLTGTSKLPVRVNVSVNGCLPLCVSPVINWRPSQGASCLSPCWHCLQPHNNPWRVNVTADGSKSFILHLDINRWCHFKDCIHSSAASVLAEAGTRSPASGIIGGV